MLTHGKHGQNKFDPSEKVEGKSKFSKINILYFFSESCVGHLNKVFELYIVQTI